VYESSLVLFLIFPLFCFFLLLLLLLSDILCIHIFFLFYCVIYTSLHAEVHFYIFCIFVYCCSAVFIISKILCSLLRLRVPHIIVNSARNRMMHHFPFIKILLEIREKKTAVCHNTKHDTIILRRTNSAIVLREYLNNSRKPQ